MTEPTTGADVVDELTTDHREATALLDELLTTGDPETRRDMADTVITELVRHSVAEEMYVYPAMREHLPDGEKAVEHDIEEHKELERTMKELEGVRRRRPALHGAGARAARQAPPPRHGRGERAVPAAARPRAPREAREDAGAGGDREEDRHRPGRTRARPTARCSTSSSGPVSG